MALQLRAQVLCNTFLQYKYGEDCHEDLTVIRRMVSRDDFMCSKVVLEAYTTSNVDIGDFYKDIEESMGIHLDSLLIPAG